jgi:multidrug efflux pump subunit AcrA (membrane-fusion protein)
MRKKFVVLSLVLILALVGCSTGATPSPTAEITPVVNQAALSKIVAEAVIEPARWSELRFEQGGTVIEVLVSEGDGVAAGDVLVRLDDVTARLTVLEAEAALAAAKAQLAQIKAGPREEELQVAEAELNAAESGVSQAAAQRDELQSGGVAANVAAAEAQLAAAVDQEWNARNLYNHQGWRMGDGAETQLEAAEAALVSAEAQLAHAQSGGEAQLRAANAAVWAATAQRDVAEARLALTAAGATPEEVAVAEASVLQAKAALDSARAALDRLVIRAPFAGTVTQLNVEPGETAAPGEVIVVLATLDRLHARTIDLTELDVVKVRPEQPVAVTVDALPDSPLSGRVERIDLQAVDYRGDVTYPVYVTLVEPPESLRWGMTAVVEVDLGE